MHWAEQLIMVITLEYQYHQSGIRDRTRFLRLYFPLSFNRWLIRQMQLLADQR